MQAESTLSSFNMPAINYAFTCCRHPLKASIKAVYNYAGFLHSAFKIVAPLSPLQHSLRGEFKGVREKRKRQF
jgi:hypothetical protein